MAKERKVQATFSDGTVIARGSKTRVYTHAWFARYTWPASGEFLAGNAEKCGFSTSEDQCRRNMTAELAWVGKRKGIVFSVHEVAPAVEVRSASELRAERIPEDSQ